jgi:hypothetical protein
MSHTNRNFIIAYVVLVGLPIVALLGVLKSGRHMQAPLSVDGTWKLQTAVERSAWPSCFQSISWLTDSSLAISQSGPGLILSSNTAAKPMASGSIEGTAIRASIQATGSACGSDNLTLIARVDPNSEPRSLTGTLSVEGCTTCSTMSFSAVRQPRTVKGTR